MIVAIAKETFPSERRVALIPPSLPALVKAGLEVLVQSGAGESAGYPDQQYAAKGAKIVPQRQQAFAADVLLQMDEEFYRKQRELMARVVAEHDVVITTAAVPGKKAPVLITGEMVAGMGSGSVIVDLDDEIIRETLIARDGKVVHPRVLALL